jgi:hypothetical protein
MNKNIFLSVVALLFLTGCAGVDLSEVSDEDLERISEKAVVCNAPYIRVGVECCLDQNDNNICDRDEVAPELEIDEILHEFDEIEEFHNDEDLGNLLDDEEDSKSHEKNEEEHEDKDDEKESEDHESDEDEHSEKLKFKADSIEVEYDREDNTIEVEWEKLDNKDNFKYYKVLISSTDSDVKYPETDAKFVGQDVSETKFEISTDKLDKGVNYFRVGYVLANDEVFHTEVIEVLIE